MGRTHDALSGVPDRNARQILVDLAQVLTELNTVSHANGASYEFADSSTMRGERWRTRDKPVVPHLGGRHNPGAYDTKKPQGAVDWKGDRTPEYRQKSAEHFWRIACEARTVDDLRVVLRDAEWALEDWRRTPPVAGVTNEPGSFRWKCEIADDMRSVDEVVRIFGVSRSVVYKYRSTYRGIAQRPRDVIQSPAESTLCSTAGELSGAKLCGNCGTRVGPFNEKQLCKTCAEFASDRQGDKDPFDQSRERGA